MATMTLSEAEKILDIVSAALQDTSHRHHPVSALKGYDIYQICTAIKLRIANEFLLLANRADFDGRFTEGLNLYDSIPYHVMRFVPDNQVNNIDAEMVFNPIDPLTMNYKDERLAAEETVSSFGEYCKSVGSKDLIYWQKIYTRLGLQYTSESPKENDPVYENEAPENTYKVDITRGSRNKFLTPLDYVAMFITMIAGTLFIVALLVVILRGAAIALWHEIRTFGSLDKADTITLIVIVTSFVWCIIRWKALNSES